MTSKPISVIPNHKIAIMVKVMPPTNTLPQRYKVSVGRTHQTYSRSSLSQDVKDGALIAVKQFIHNHPSCFLVSDTTFVLSSIPDGFVAVAVDAVTLERINEL